MPLLTTLVGVYPKPAYVPVRDWFGQGGGAVPGQGDASRAEELRAVLDRATREVVREQVRLGIDLPTDGEVRRENYIHYHCRHLAGVDTENLTRKSMRSGEWVAFVPTITGPIGPGEPFLPRDWRVAQSAADRPVKMTVPGPLTIIDSTADAYYGDEPRLARDLAEALNVEIRRLAEAGCRHIQVDEPVFARRPDQALAYGIECLNRCFHGLPREVTRVVHVCCGYPDRLDSEHYQKASPEAYFQLAPALDTAGIDAVSLEDAHRKNDLALFDLFKNTAVILGVVDVARSRIETADEIESRLREVLDRVEPHRLMAAPDCGLGLLTRRMVLAKLKNLVRAAGRI